MLDATHFEGVSVRRVADNAREAYTDALGALIERNGVQFDFPTPMAVVRWARERIFNRAIKSIDAKVPDDREGKGDAKSKRR